MRKTIIDSSSQIVVNVIEIEEDAVWEPVEGQEIGPDGGEIGWQWNGTQWVNLNPPETVERHTHG
jgi:hypothetical protein